MSERNTCNALFGTTVQQHNQRLGAINPLKIFDAIYNQMLVFRRNKLDMFLHRLRTTQTETLVGTTDSNHLAVVFKQIIVLRLVLPRNDIDTVGTLIAVVYAAFRAVELFTAIDKRHSLRH